jgi:Subtilase family
MLPDGKANSNLPQKATLSLTAALARQRRLLRAGAAELGAASPEARGPNNLLSLVVESKGTVQDIQNALELREPESIESLAEGFLSAKLYPSSARRLLDLAQVEFAQCKTIYEPHVRTAVAAIGIGAGGSEPGRRLVAEDGSGVFIGIVDSGFDLSHPAFWAGGRLRVSHLLDQVDGGEYDTAALEKMWTNGQRPGDDPSGHGTHVASVAAGTRHYDYEGVAPNARFLLVRTDFENTDEAVAWIFKKASSAPCVVNLSLGGHDGSHDGTGDDERLHSRITRPGHLVVTAAGNDRQRRAHFGHNFFTSEVQEILFDVFRPVKGTPFIALNFWSHPQDEFRIVLRAPDGSPFEVPASGELGPFKHGLSEIYLAAYPRDPANQAHASRIEIHFQQQSEDLAGWRLQITCDLAVYGRFDGWISLSRQGAFHVHPMVGQLRTLCMPATGPGCIAVGSFTSRSQWDSEVPPLKREDKQAVRGRVSRFSSFGPTRDGRWKPDISAPGEHICAALARDSYYGGLTDRAQPRLKLVTVAPVRRPRLFPACWP